MNFLKDLVRWFVKGERRKNVPISQPEFKQEGPVPVVKKSAPKYESPMFDFLKDNPSSNLLVDLQSIRPLAEQFDRAREDLLKELQRLAPPEKRIFDIFKKAA